MNWYSRISLQYKILLVSLVGSIGFTIFFIVNTTATQTNNDRLTTISEVDYKILSLLSENKELLYKTSNGSDPGIIILQ